MSLFQEALIRAGQPGKMTQDPITKSDVPECSYNKKTKQQYIQRSRLARSFKSKETIAPLYQPKKKNNQKQLVSATLQRETSR